MAGKHFLNPFTRIALLILVACTACGPHSLPQPDTQASADLCDKDNTGCTTAEWEAEQNHGKPFTPAVVDNVFWADEPCAPLTHSVSPAEADRKNFISRQAGDAPSHLNPSCIAKVFTPQEIDNWAAKGDPVAQYVGAYQKLRGGGCTAFAPAAKQLRAALEVPSGIPHTSSRRVPEAALALYHSSTYCAEIKDAVEARKYLRAAQVGPYNGLLPM